MLWLQLIITINMTLCFIFIFIVLLLPSNRKGNHGLLLGFIGCVGISQFVTLISNVDDLQHQLLEPFLFLTGPLLFSYVRQNSHLGKLNSKVFLVILTPAFLLALKQVLLWVLILIEFDINNARLLEFHRNLLDVYILFEAAFILGSLFVIWQFEHVLAAKLTSQILRLKWLKRLCLLDLLILLIEPIEYFIFTYLEVEINIIQPIIPALLSFTLVFIAYLAIREPTLLYADKLDKDSNKYQHSGLRKDSSEYFSAKMDNVMLNQHLYLNCDLTLKILAEEVGLSEHNLSQLLNQTYKKSYHNYINELRIEYSKKLLLSSDLSIDEVGYSSGFNSKVSFYNLFKKSMGMTPGAWRDSQ